MSRVNLCKRTDGAPGAAGGRPRAVRARLVLLLPALWGAVLFLAGFELIGARPVAARPRAGGESSDVAADTLRLSLSEAIARALESSPRLAAMEATQRAAGASARAARAAGLPSVDLSAGYSRYSDVPDFVLTLPGGRAQTIAPNIPDAWRARTSVTVPLFTGWRIAGAADAALSERYAVGNDLAAVRADVVLEATTAYWNLRTQREAASVLREALAAYESHLVDARNRARVGLAAPNEVLAVEVERDRAELGRLQADGSAAVAEENLRGLLALPARVLVIAADLPGDTPAGPGSAASAAPAPDSLVTIALTTRPERKALAERMAAAEARVRSERGARWPQLAAIAGYDYANPNRRLTPALAEWKETWDASVYLSLPLFDSGRISAATARARAQAEALRQQAIDLDRRIRLEVTSRAIECRTAEAALAVSERALDSARENEKVTRDRYREGVAASSELLDAEVSSLRAALDRTDAQARRFMAQASLDRAVGRLW
jgi:outer membrane protein